MLFAVAEAGIFWNLHSGRFQVNYIHINNAFCLRIAALKRRKKILLIKKSKRA